MSSEPSAFPDSWHAFLASRGAHAVQGRVLDFGAAPAELAAARDATVLCDLSHNALVAVTGDDAVAFLHAQLTSDVQGLPEGAAQWSGWCTAKGRLLATFLLVRRAEGCLLAMPAEVAPGVVKRLRMFVLRSKVKIEEIGTENACFAFAGKSAAVLVARHCGFAPDPMRSLQKDGTLCVALSEDRFVIAAPVAEAMHLWDAFAEQAKPAGADAWDWMMVRAGVPIIVAATQEAFVPQMANFDLLGAVSFHKGCYPGQEIVARTQYRGILKRRMGLAHAEVAARPAAGERVFSTAFGDQAAGEVANAAPSPDGGYDLLVVAQIESLRRGDLRLAAPDGPALRILRHPAAEDAA